jgi:hypothetical protein
MYPTCAGPETDITDPQVVSRRNTVIAGIDPVLIDAYGCINFFDIQPQELTHLLRAHESGCGDLDVEAALADNRIRLFKVGAPLPVEPVAADATLIATQAPLVSKPTAVIIPPSELSDQPAASSALDGTNCAPTNQGISPGSLLDTALIPVAAILGGFGLAVLTRMRRRLPKETSATPQLPDQKDDSNNEAGRG